MFVRTSHLSSNLRGITSDLRQLQHNLIKAQIHSRFFPSNRNNLKFEQPVKFTFSDCSMSCDDEVYYAYAFEYWADTDVQDTLEVDEIPKCVIPGIGDSTLSPSRSPPKEVNPEFAYLQLPPCRTVYWTSNGHIVISQEQQPVVGEAYTSDSLHLPETSSASTESPLYAEHNRMSLFPHGEPEQTHIPPLSSPLEARSTAEGAQEQCPDERHQEGKGNAESGSKPKSYEIGGPHVLTNLEREASIECAKIREVTSGYLPNQDGVSDETVRQQRGVEDEDWILC